VEIAVADEDGVELIHGRTFAFEKNASGGPKEV
jgi:hypothetical protein